MKTSQFRWVSLLIVLCALGCAGKGSVARPAQPPRKPPAVPARTNAALDDKLVEAARSELDAASTSNDGMIRAHAIEAMRDSQGLEAAAAILAALDDPARMVRFAAAMAAGELRLPAAKQKLIALAEDADPNVRIAAKFALHRLGDTRLSHDFEKTAQDPNPYVRANTMLALGLLGEPTADKVLKPLLMDRNAAVRLQAAEALWRLGNRQGLETLVAATISAYPDDQMIALVALAGPRDQRVIEHVRGSLTTDYEEVNLVAARAMGMLGSDQGYGVALKGAKSTDPRQRLLAALAFGAIGRTDAQGVLAGLLKDPQDDVRIAAAAAILQLKMAK